MKSIKEKSDEYLQQEKDEVLCVYDRYAGFLDGANYVLGEIELYCKEHVVCNTNIKHLIEQLKEK